jgi:hypothetical protein
LTVALAIAAMPSFVKARRQAAAKTMNSAAGNGVGM